MAQKQWPWTPTSGAVAGHTFATNQEYRAALDAANRKRETVLRVAHQLYDLVDAYAEADVLVVKGEEAMATFYDRVLATAEKLTSIH
jgi:hypothetical protein